VVDKPCNNHAVTSQEVKSHTFIPLSKKYVIIIFFWAPNNIKITPPQVVNFLCYTLVHVLSEKFPSPRLGQLHTLLSRSIQSYQPCSTA
jgi:hypothetical protein